MFKARSQVFGARVVNLEVNKNIFRGRSEIQNIKQICKLMDDNFQNLGPLMFQS